MTNFTESHINKLPPAEKGKRYTVKDDKINGFICRITDKGTKTYAIYKKVNGEPLKVTIGKTNEISLYDARIKALEILTQINKGENPNVEKNKIKKESTLKSLMNDYIEKYSKKYTKQKTWQGNIGIYNKHLSMWDNRKIGSIKKQEIEKLHTKIGTESGIYIANYTLTLIRHMYNKAIEWGFDGDNPTNGIKKYKTKSRDRFLQPEEISTFFKAIYNIQDEVIRSFFLISIYTGQRKSNVLSMHWDEINLNSKTWHIPETKNGEALTVPLVNDAYELLKNLYQRKTSDEWVFPSKKSKSGHFEEPKRIWRSLLKQAGIENLRIHDIRRTLGSYQAISGSSLHIIGKSLGHKTSKATMVYARLNEEPVRNSMENAINMIKSIEEENKTTK